MRGVGVFLLAALAACGASGKAEQTGGVAFNAYWEVDNSSYTSPKNINSWVHAAPLGPEAGGPALNLTYSVAFAETWGGVAGNGHTLPGNLTYDITGCEELSLEYRVARPQSVKDLAVLRLVLKDSRECVARCWDPDNMEHYFAAFPVLDDTEAVWKTLRVPLRAFETKDWSGCKTCNRVLDLAYLKTFQIDFSIQNVPPERMGPTTTGEAHFRNVRCSGQAFFQEAFGLPDAGLPDWRVHGCSPDRGSAGCYSVLQQRVNLEQCSGHSGGAFSGTLQGGEQPASVWLYREQPGSVTYKLDSASELWLRLQPSTGVALEACVWARGTLPSPEGLQCQALHLADGGPDEMTVNFGSLQTASGQAGVKGFGLRLQSVGKAVVDLRWALECKQCGAWALTGWRIPLFFASYVVALAVACLLLAAAATHTASVDEVYRWRDTVQLDTHTSHRLLAVFGMARVRLAGTGSRMDGEYLARSLGGRRLELRTLSGKRLDLDKFQVCSRGYVRQPLAGALLRSALMGSWLPTPLVVGALLALAGLLVEKARFSDPEDGCTLGSGWLGLGTLAAFLLPSLAVWLARCYRPPRSPVEQDLASYRRELVKRGAPWRVDRGPERAVPVRQLEELYERLRKYIQDRSMRYVVANVVLPLTEPKKPGEDSSLAELLGPSRVRWFVTHAWDQPFSGMVATLRKHADLCEPADPGATAYWICAFSINQWKTREEFEDHGPMESSFCLALNDAGCRGTLLAMDRAATPLTRIWCIFELWQTFERQRRHQSYQFLFGARSGVLGLQNDDLTDVSLAVRAAKAVAHIDVESASASQESDKRAITELVRQCGGYPVINRFVRCRMQAALVATRQRAEADFEKLGILLLPDTSVPDSPKAAEEGRAKTVALPVFHRPGSPMLGNNQVSPVPAEGAVPWTARTSFEQAGRRSGMLTVGPPAMFGAQPEGPY